MSKNIFNLSAFLLMLLFSISILSCGDDDLQTTDDDKVQLLSFGPSGVQLGETIIIIGRNLETVNAVEFAPQEVVAKENFITQTNTNIELTVPMTAERGKIKLITADEEIESITEIDFEVLFTVTNFPLEGKPGTDITIQGELLNWVDLISFHKNIEIDSFISQTNNEIVVTIPLEAQTGPVIIIGKGTEPGDFETEMDFIATLPTIAGFSPQNIRHNEELTINGTNLDLTKEVVFSDGTSISVDDFNFISETEIKINVPNTAVDGLISLITYSDVEVLSGESISIVLPNITSLSPSPIDVGAVLTIGGNNLDLVQSISFPEASGEITNFISQSPTEIQVVIPDGTKTGYMEFKTIHEVIVITEEKLWITAVPLSYAFFDDSFQNGWQDWSSGGAVEAPNTEFVFDGNASIKKTFDANYDILYFGGSMVDVSSYSEIVVYAYGAPGTNGETVQMVLNDQWSSAVGFMNIVEGEWTEFTFPLGDLIFASGAGNQWINFILQNQEFTGTVYFDFIGFR